MAEKKKIFLWDIDGTLLLTGGAGVVAFERVFESLFGKKNIWDNINPDGRTDPSIVDEIFEKNFGKKASAEEQENIKNLYNKIMAEELPRSPRFRIMPMASEIIASLFSQKNTYLGLATGNYKETAFNKLKQGGFNTHAFLFGGYGCDAYERIDLTRLAHKRALQHVGEDSETYLIGDTVHDVRCGKAIGATVVAVCTGSTPRAQLEAENPHVVLDTLENFPY
ncbi:HAD hydrolase-like protein [bacterium]|nr:HAD hydrolase-like protein [bacterium]